MPTSGCASAASTSTFRGCPSQSTLMDCQMADAYAPDLGVGTARQQALGGSQAVVGDIEGSAVHVEGHDPPAVAGLDLRAHMLLVQIATTAGVLFFAVTGLVYRHGSFPIRRVGNPRNRIVHQPGGPGDSAYSTSSRRGGHDRLCDGASPRPTTSSTGRNLRSDLSRAGLPRWLRERRPATPNSVSRPMDLSGHETARRRRGASSR
jgi:hypothetical protein